MIKINLKSTEGSHGRHLQAWIEDIECSWCEKPGKCLLMDGSEQEYKSPALCTTCLRSVILLIEGET